VEILCPPSVYIPLIETLYKKGWILENFVHQGGGVNMFVLGKIHRVVDIHFHGGKRVKFDARRFKKPLTNGPAQANSVLPTNKRHSFSKKGRKKRFILRWYLLSRSFWYHRANICIVACDHAKGMGRRSFVRKKKRLFLSCMILLFFSSD